MKRKRHLAVLLLVVLLAAATALPTRAVNVEGTDASGGKWEKIPSCSSVTLPKNTGSSTVVAGKMTSKQTVTVWTEKELTEEEQKQVEALVRQQSGIGNPKKINYINGEGSESLGMTVNHDTVTFTKSSDWAMIYMGSYATPMPSPTAAPTATVPVSEKPSETPSITPTAVPSEEPGESPEPSVKPNKEPTRELEEKFLPVPPSEEPEESYPPVPPSEEPEESYPPVLPSEEPEVSHPPVLPSEEPESEKPAVIRSRNRRSSYELKTVREAKESTGKTELYDVRTTASGGDTVEYRVMTAFPMRGGTLPEEYRIEDVLSAGLRYAPGTLTIDFYRRISDKAPLVSWEKDDYSVEYEETETGSAMCIRASQTGLDKLVGAGQDILLVVRYAAVLRCDDSLLCADEGNGNTVSLFWRFADETTEHRLTDSCRVRTCEVELRSVLAEERTVPQTGSVVIRNVSDKVYLTLQSENGVWYVTGYTASSEDATRISVEGSNPITVRGIEDDLYRLEADGASVSFRLNP